MRATARLPFPLLLLLLALPHAAPAATADEPNKGGPPEFKYLKFRNIGPATMGGRIDDLAVVESDPRIMYAGSAAGEDVVENLTV